MRIRTMRIPAVIAAAATAALLASCSSLTGNRTVDSGIVGAGAGAAVGAVTPGISTTEGALGGAAAGAIYGAVTNDKHSHDYCIKRYPQNSREYQDCRDGK